MIDLEHWLEAHANILIEGASAELSTDEALKRSVEESIAAFYEALAHSAQAKSPTPVRAIMIDWIEARSAPTDEQPAGLMPVLTTLKRVTWEQIRCNATSEEAVEFASNYLASLEAEALLNDMRRDLAQAQTHVQYLDKNKSDFIAVAAHELKTPLTLIEGYTNMLRGDVDEAQDPRVALMLSGIASGAVRLKEIVGDMIDVSLIEMRMLGLHFQPVWIHGLLQMVEFELSDAVHERNIQLVVKHEDLQDKPTYCDPERMHQVFQKVLYNAVKYTPDGGTITISARDLPGFTDITISDTGIGIAAENLIRIFDKFSSMTEVALHSSGKVKYKGGGPGLGLAIARGIIEAHGGSIWAESPGYDEENTPGTTFHIMVPMRSAPPEDQMALMFTLQAEFEGWE